MITVSDFEEVLEEDLLAVPTPVNQLIGLNRERNEVDFDSESRDILSYVQVSRPCLSLEIIFGAPRTLVISV